MSSSAVRLLQIGRQMPALEQALAARYQVHCLADEADPQAFLAAHGAEFQALVTSAAIGVEHAVVQALPNLKVISSFGVGLDKIDVAAARAQGVAVGYTPEVLTDCVADLAFGLLIDAARGLSAADRFVRRGDWERSKFPMSTRVSGKKLGIFGLGRIGRAIARRASGFDMAVHYTNRQPAEGVSYGFEPSLLELARWSDFLVIAAAGGQSTHHLVNAEVLSALGAQGFLVNVARGSVIDEAALVQALSHRTIAGAGLDVFEDEPHVPAALRALDNVVLLPHVASGTHETRQAMADRVLDNLARFFADGTLVSAA
ncbi:2-hydroxyacid dehydrogenase [Curvibacter sp. HBC61]|uniref:2-hydroxyacid dehydrogenase n=1 Tax=Curvibacter cyanobacteriorum TaxID=3026422 RepID=A0ABT5MXS0_9BURK|nr:2-hydroxyacid dehydrogenase [Curvibacter sp. HBC61]MDD0838618.1 2-hydroxyacid dehydrogenase [Curvibacter sp. HBC61]